MTPNPAIRKYDGAAARLDAAGIWAAISAPIPADRIQWRQDGRPINKDGKHYARFVAYVDAGFVWERLDAVVPGEWDLTLELLPPVGNLDEDANQGACSFKARLQILGVIREDVGTGKDYKQASSDAFKRAAVRFGVARELYAYEKNWVPMDGDGKYAKPTEDPATCYARRYGKRAPLTEGEKGEVARLLEEGERAIRGEPGEAPAAVYRTGGEGKTDATVPAPATTNEEVACPKCGGRTWDNRLSKRNPKAPDYKCRDRSCDGVIWPPKDQPAGKPGRESSAGPHHADEETDDLPF